MKTLGLSEAKESLAELCRQVALTGEAYILTESGKPLVEIIPARSLKRKPILDAMREERERNGPIEEDLELPERDPSKNRPSPFEDE